MQCYNCGAEVPEGRTTCPNCAANLLNPRKNDEKKSTVKYQTSIKPFFWFCMVEWMFMLVSLVATIYGLCIGGWGYFTVGVYRLTDRFITLLLVSGITIVLMAASRWTYQEMKCFEESFSRAFIYKVVMIVAYCLTSVPALFLLCIPLAVLASIYYYHLFWALAVYINDLSPQMSRSLDRYAIIYIIMIILAVLNRMFIPVVVLAGGLEGENYMGITTIPVAIHSVLLIVLSCILWKMYRLCRLVK